jgi:anaerobic dimethyl sulfoxide reductase subunit C (anchor subunit)
MRKGEWPLVIFTLLVQMAIGLFLLLSIFRSFMPASTVTNIFDNLFPIGYWIILLLLIIGVFAGTFHLGRPINARLAMANMKKSWLSREMFLGLFFGLFTLALSLISWLEIHSTLMWNLLLIMGSIVAIALLYAISRIYMLRTVPTWNTIVIPLSLCSSAFLLGSILFCTIITFLLPSLHLTSDLSQEIEGLLHWIEFGSLGLMFIQVLLSYMMLKGFQSQIHLIDAGIKSTWVKYRLIFMLRLGLGSIGIALYINFMDQFMGSFHSESSLGYLLFVSFLLIFLSEVSGRILFYTSYKRFGI